jgi:3alpha(or 20beta)-hydroxysteroid dehydrogenase
MKNRENESGKNILTQQGERAKRFNNRTVIVTGGARGMGASHARGFIAEGANVVIADVLEQEGRTLADELGDQAIFSRLDVTSDADWAATVAAAEGAFGPVSVLINNAGIVRSGPIAETELAAWRQVIDINLTGTYLGTRAVVPSMRKAGGGAIVNISSTEGMRGNFGIGGVHGQQMGSAGTDQDGGAGARARQHPRQLDSPRRYPHPDDSRAGSGGVRGVGKRLGDSARGRA